MPNIVNEILMKEFCQDFEEMGSCLVMTFDKVTVEQADDIRSKFREAGVRYKVVKNRIAVKAFDSMGLDLSSAFSGKCGVVLAEEEGAISAAKIVREVTKKQKKDPPFRVTGGVIEGEAIVGDAAKMIADMPDKNTVRAQILGCMSGPARGLAVCMSGLQSGLARCLQQRADGEGGAGE